MRTKTDGVLSPQEASELLGVSKASLSNWKKQGILRSLNKDEIENLLQRIKSGEVSKLNKRANKNHTSGIIKEDNELSELCSLLLELPINMELLLLLFSARQFIHHNIITEEELDSVFNLPRKETVKSIALNHIEKRFLELKQNSLVDSSELEIAKNVILKLDIPLLKPSEKDIAGIVYQSISQRGNRSQKGAFYTPGDVADKIVQSAISTCENYTAKKISNIKFIDPCCGTGQFLISFLKAGGKPENVCGIDLDSTAAFLAGSNIILQCHDIENNAKILCGNTLLNENLIKNNEYDILVTNPPWGAFKSKDREKLSFRFPLITSGESFSYFICKAFEIIQKDGLISLILPESFLNVNRHNDIRSFIFDNGSLNKVTNLGKVFNKVFSSAISLEITKRKVKIKNKDFLINKDLSISINLNSKDIELIDRLYSDDYMTLENKADWALGIVTGNNKELIINECLPGYEAVIRGSDILKGSIKQPQTFLRFTPEFFHQTAAETKYRHCPKLIYRFISKRLVFAIDNESRLTLNSANILIPDCNKIGLTEEELISLFNTDLYSFIFQKRFNSLKVLRSHIEKLPLMKPKKIFSIYAKEELEYIAENTK